MTSFGDVFNQSYEATRPVRRDKTCSAGLGSESVKLSSEYLTVVRHWLDEALDQMLPVAEDSKLVSFTHDIRPLMKRNSSFMFGNFLKDLVTWSFDQVPQQYIFQDLVTWTFD
jgi:hypothetical protein